VKFKRAISFFLLSALMLISQASAFAQCAMCKTSVESDLNSGGSIGKGLNTGILYLMAIPYVLLMTGAYFAFRKTIDAKIKGWKEKFFPKKQVR
jgi:hypothetical protein